MANQPSQRHIIGRRIADQAFQDNGGRKTRRGSLRRNSSSRRRFIHRREPGLDTAQQGVVHRNPMPRSSLSIFERRIGHDPGHSRASRNVINVCEEHLVSRCSGQTQRMQQDVTG